MTHDTLAASLQAAVAAEIRHVRHDLERLAELFVADQYVAANYLEQLQAFDALIQHADESAALLDRMSAGVDPHAAVAAVRLDAVQGRLHAALRQAT